MLLNSNIEVAPCNERYIISHNNEKYFIVNENTLKVINSLRENTLWDLAYFRFKENCPEEISFEEYKETSQKIISKLSEKNISIIKNYLPVRIQIFSSKFIGNISKYFAFLFNYTLFYSLFSICLLINIINLVLIADNYSARILFSGSGEAIRVPHIVFLLILIVPLIHELGHIAGCRKFKATHGGIGFGFYFIFPIFYSDVSGIWMISKRNRIIVNLGGIFFELIYTSGLILIAFFTDNTIIRIFASINFFVVLQQLNPLFRYDGYWILSDLIDMPNLKLNSRKAFSSVLLNLIKKGNTRLSPKLLFLALFCILSYGFFLVFVFVIFFSYTREILRFPLTVFLIIKGLFSGNLDLNSINIGMLVLVSFFYFLLLQFLWNIIKVRYFKRDELSGNQNLNP